MGDERTYALLCPNGHEIVKTIEITTGTAGIDPASIRPTNDGYGFDFEWDEMGTDYGDSETLTVEKVRQFYCEEFEQHGEGELRLVVEDEDGAWVAPTKELGLV